MIWHFNPKRNELFVPETVTIIPKVKNLETARSIMSTFNPVNWQYIVKSKTSKVYNFATLEDAVNTAKKKSAKGTIYTVFSNGKALASYIGDKELTRWTTVWESRNEDRRSVNEFYYSIPRGEFAKEEDLFSEVIQTAQDKVRYTDVYIKYVKCRNGHLRTEFTRTSKVFHKNGSVYYFNRGRIEHMSAEDMQIYLCDEALDVLRNELTKLRPELKHILKDANRKNIIGVFSRPTAYYEFDTYHKKCHERHFGRLYYGYYPREIVDESKMIDTLCKRMRIPCTKNLRKIYNENPHNMDVVHWLKAVGFKDVNSYRKLVGVGIHFCLDNPDKFKDFFKKFIKLRGENNAVRMLCDADFNLIEDISWSYATIDEDAAEFVIRKARNIEEIHDTFNISCPKKSAMIETMIHYTEKDQKRFNLSCNDDVRFELASSNKDLAIIGAEMGICVGGYADKALSKSTTIVKMLKGDKYVACIEVRKNHLVQLKAKFNNPVERRYKKYIDEWLDHAKLKIDCNDYHRIGQPWDSTYNYAHIRPNDYEPAEHHSVLQIVKVNHIHFKHNNNWFLKHQLGYERIDRIQEMAFNPEEERHTKEWSHDEIVIDPEEEHRVEERSHNEMAGFQAVDIEILPF